MGGDYVAVKPNDATHTPVPGMACQLIVRFSPSHSITTVYDDRQRWLDDQAEWLNNLAGLDQLLATWEWRSGSNPWLVMQAKG